MSKELVVIDRNTNLSKVFVRPVMDNFLSRLRAEKEKFIADVNTEEGRKAIGSFAKKIGSSKMAVDNAGKEYVAELKEIPKLIDAERKYFRDGADAIRDEVLAPLVAWKAVREEIDARIGDFNTAIREAAELNSSVIKEKISWLNSFSPENVVEDKRDEFMAALDNTKIHLENAYLKAKKSEEEAAELERLRAEEADRKRKEEEEAKIKEAEERARREADEKAREKELEAKLANERAEKWAESCMSDFNKAIVESYSLDSGYIKAKILWLDSFDHKGIIETKRDKFKKTIDKAREHLKLLYRDVKKTEDEKAERESREREERAAAQAKEQAEREAREREEKERADRERREADKKNRRSKINEAESSLRMNGYSAEEAERFVSLVIEGKIANIKMVF